MYRTTGKSALLLTLVFAGWVSQPVRADEMPPSYMFCGKPLGANAFGRPLDYNDPKEDARIHDNVEQNHFNRNVQALVKGQTGVLPLDIAYVLSQIPNHYRALATMAKWERQNSYHPSMEEQQVYSADCYFRRALTFQPKDPTLHMLYGIHLHYLGNKQAALQEYLTGTRFDPDHVELNYNLGLLYIELENYEAALAAAHVAYRQGFPLSGLKRKLARLGQWSDQGQ